MPFLGLLALAAFKKMFRKKHLGQVVPIEDVERIFGIVNSVVRIPCICRRSTVGKDVRYCFALSVNPGSIGMAQYVDKSYFGGPDVSVFERMDKKDALEFMKSLEPSGIIHTVWTVLTPFVALVCNCGYDGCIPMQSQKEITPILIKSEYAAVADEGLCNGCKRCGALCLYGAITFDRASKARIDEAACSGCGICRSVCAAGAISLSERKVSGLQQDRKIYAS
jgi:ferredoxin